jgi:hypothetical protein
MHHDNGQTLSIEGLFGANSQSPLADNYLGLVWQ